MKLLLLSPTPVPPTFGGQDRLLDGLRAALNERHPTDLIKIPVDERTREGCLKGYWDFYNFDASAYDRVITYKAPAYMVRHPNQVLYLSHRMRVFYDLYKPADADHERMRDLIHFLDGWGLDKRRLPFVFTVGETVTRRLMRYGGIESVPIHHPTTAVVVPPKPGEYFLSVGRLHEWKRVDLIVRAMRLAKVDCPLKIVGEGPDEARLRELAGDDPRIEFLGKLTDDELAETYSRALCTIFPPISEDMGLITFESFLSGKPILTTGDAGEPALIVKEGETGFVCAPEPESMAHSLEQMWTHREAVDAMGANCLEWMKQVTWERLVNRLLDAGDRIERGDVPRPSAPAIHVGVNGSAPAPEPDDGRIRLLVTDNQIIDPPVGGGRIRILELYRHLPDDFATTYVGMFDWPGPTFRDQQYAPNFREVVTPMTARHFRAHNRLQHWTRGAATVDVTMPLLARLTPRWRRLIDRHLPGKHVLICAHPWLWPYLPRGTGLPTVYDSQNCEAAVKGPLLSRTLVGRAIAAKVRSTERRAVLESDLVLACSDADAEQFVRRYGVDTGKIFEAANGVDCDRIRPASPEEKRAARERLGVAEKSFVVFTGSNYLPNLEGAEFVVNRLAPNFPDTKFGVVGGVGVMFRERHPGREIPPNVELYGFVEAEKLLDVYRAADVALNPMLQGSGTNIKMLDYMAAGLPIATTPVGARGLKGKGGEQWIEAPVEGLGRELAALLASEDARRKFAEAGRAHAESFFDWKRISEKYAERLRAMVGRG